MTLYYELEILEGLIKDSFHPKNFSHKSSLSEKDFYRLSEFLIKEKDSVKRRLKKVTYSYPKENHRKLYVQQHQFAVTNLKNILVDFLLPRNSSDLLEMPKDTLKVKLYKRSLNAMKDLFAFIRDEFPQYFNYDEQVPEVIVLGQRENLTSRINDLKKKLLTDGHESKLVDLITIAFQIFFETNSGQELTYRKFSYLKELLTGLEELKQNEYPFSPYPLLISFLISKNFNSPKFKNYLAAFIHSEINKCESLIEKIEIISFHHKEISQLLIMPGESLVHDSRSVQLDVATWLFNEMTHLEKKQTLGLVAPMQFKDSGHSLTEKGIYSTLTVEELGLLFKVLKDTNLVRNKNMKQLARDASEHWHTKQKENISWQYLYNSMSTIEAGTIRSLEDKFVGLVNWLRKIRQR